MIVSFIILRQTANKCYRHADFYSFCIVWISVKIVCRVRSKPMKSHRIRSLFSYLCESVMGWLFGWSIGRSVRILFARAYTSIVCSFLVLVVVFFFFVFGYTRELSTITPRKSFQTKHSLTLCLIDIDRL